MGTHPLHDVALRIHSQFASEPRRQWLLDRLREWRRAGCATLVDSAGNSLTPTAPERHPHWPPRGKSEVNAAGELPSGEPDPDGERSTFAMPEICFAMAAIHDGYRGIIERAMNVEVEPLVERGGTLWKLLWPHYGLRVAFEQRATSNDWTTEPIDQLNVLVDQAITAASANKVTNSEQAELTAEVGGECSNSVQGETASSAVGAARLCESATSTNNGAVSDARSEIAVEDSLRKIASLDEVPAEFRDGGIAGGEPLTAKVVGQPEKYNLKGPYISKYYKGPRLIYGKEHIFLHGEIARLSDILSSRNRQREENQGDSLGCIYAESFPQTIEGMEK